MLAEASCLISNIDRRNKPDLSIGHPKSSKITFQVSRSDDVKLLWDFFLFAHLHRNHWNSYIQYFLHNQYNWKLLFFQGEGENLTFSHFHKGELKKKKEGRGRRTPPNPKRIVTKIMITDNTSVFSGRKITSLLFAVSWLHAVKHISLSTEQIEAGFLA